MKPIDISIPDITAWTLAGLTVDMVGCKVECRIVIFSGAAQSGSTMVIVGNGASYGFAANPAPTAAHPTIGVQMDVPTGYIDLVAAITSAGSAEAAVVAIENFLTTTGLAPQG